MEQEYEVIIENLSDPNGHPIKINGRFTKEELIEQIKNKL